MAERFERSQAKVRRENNRNRGEDERINGKVCDGLAFTDRVPTDRQHGIRQDFDPSHLSPETRTQAAHTFRRGRVLLRFFKGATD